MELKRSISEEHSCVYGGCIRVAKMSTFYFDKSRDLEVNLFYCKLNER